MSEFPSEATLLPHNLRQTFVGNQLTNSSVQLRRASCQQQPSLQATIGGYPILMGAKAHGILSVKTFFSGSRGPGLPSVVLSAGRDRPPDPSRPAFAPFPGPFIADGRAEPEHLICAFLVQRVRDSGSETIFSEISGYFGLGQ